MDRGREWGVCARDEGGWGRANKTNSIGANICGFRWKRNTTLLRVNEIGMVIINYTYISALRWSIETCFMSRKYRSAISECSLKIHPVPLVVVRIVHRAKFNVYPGGLDRGTVCEIFEYEIPTSPFLSNDYANRYNFSNWRTWQRTKELFLIFPILSASVPFLFPRPSHISASRIIKCKIKKTPREENL